MRLKEDSRRKYEEIPVPVWKRSPLPDGTFDGRIERAVTAVSPVPARVTVEPLDAALADPARSELAELLERAGTHRKSIGDKFENYVSAWSDDGLLIVSKATGRPVPRVTVTHRLDGDAASYLTRHLIVAEPGAQLEVVLDAAGPSGASVRHFDRTVVVARRGATVRLFKVQRLSEGSGSFESNLSVVEDGGTVEVVDVQVGSGYKAVSHESELVGREARSELRSAYYAEKDGRFDLSCTMTHGAPKTESNIVARGALADRATKVFRGNLFFENGARESVGREKETVTMLSRAARSDSFPALMCAEDDVVGEHAASVGQIDPERMFYLMSRGLSETEARRMLVKAAFEEIISGVGDEALAAAVMEELDRRMGA